MRDGLIAPVTTSAAATRAPAGFVPGGFGVVQPRGPRVGGAAASQAFHPTELDRADLPDGIIVQPGTYARLTKRFPSLAELLPQLVDSPARQARALRMLETILNALSIPGKSLSLSTVPGSIPASAANAAVLVRLPLWPRANPASSPGSR